MLRCAHCGEHALAGLAHLHGDPCRPLCRRCTELELKRQAQDLELAQHEFAVVDEFQRTSSIAA